MKVWTLTQYSTTDGTYLVGIFSSPEKAREFRELHAEEIDNLGYLVSDGPPQVRASYLDPLEFPEELRREP